MNEQEYNELKRVHAIKVKELCEIESELIKYENTRDRDVLNTYLKDGYEVSKITGHIIPNGKAPKDSFVEFALFMAQTNPSNRCTLKLLNE